MQDKALFAYTFDRDDGQNPAMKYARRYVEHWASMIERNSEYALEQVYNIVDSRYLSRLPFIITTNLPLAELQAPRDLAHARIYDRVQQM